MNTKPIASNYGELATAFAVKHVFCRNVLDSTVSARDVLGDGDRTRLGSPGRFWRRPRSGKTSLRNQLGGTAIFTTKSQHHQLSTFLLPPTSTSRRTHGSPRALRGQHPGSRATDEAVWTETATTPSYRSNTSLARIRHSIAVSTQTAPQTQTTHFRNPNGPLILNSAGGPIFASQKPQTGLVGSFLFERAANGRTHCVNMRVPF